MPKAKDVALIGDDLSIQKGDFVLLFSDEQHIEYILVADKGSWRRSGALGVGIYKELQGVRNTITGRLLENKIRSNLQFDGYRVDRVDLFNKLTVSIDAERLK